MDINWIQLITIIIAASGLIFTVAYSIASVKEGIKNLEAGQKDLSHRMEAGQKNLSRRMETGQKDLHNRVDKLDTKIATVATDLANFKTEALKTFARRTDLDIVTSQSPPCLTEKGERIAEESKINQLIAEQQERHFEELNHAQSVAEIYETCRLIAARETKERTDIVRHIKDYFYIEGIDPEVIISVFALRLRDLYQATQEATTVKA